MTLVVARKTPRGALIGADLRVTHTDDTRRGFPHGALKLVVTRPHICVAFAGSPAPGFDGIRAVQEFDDVAAIVEHLLPITTRANVEFLLADMRDSSVCVVRDGSIEQSMWVSG